MSDRYDTKLSPNEEVAFQKWKRQYAPQDSGVDYDLRGAFKAGQKPGLDGHWVDTYKKPNHPTFSNESQYATGEDSAKAGRWVNGKYVPPMADKVKKDRPVSMSGNHATEFPKRLPGDIVQRADRDKAVADANAPKTARMATVEGAVSPKIDPSKKAGPAAPTLIVVSPQSAPQRDATGMMASKPVDMPVPNIAVQTNNPNVTNPQGLANLKAEEYGKAALPPSPAPPPPWYQSPGGQTAGNIAASAAVGPFGDMVLKRAIEALRARGGK